MKNKSSYRKEIRAVLLDKITDCDEAIFAKIEEIRKIANFDRFDGQKITELCRQIEIACNESELLKELVKVKKPLSADSPI